MDSPKHNEDSGGQFPQKPLIKNFPPEWDDERVRRVLAHYENQTDEETVAEDEKTSEEEVNLALISETSLATDWLRPEEDEAWAHLESLPPL